MSYESQKKQARELRGKLPEGGKRVSETRKNRSSSFNPHFGVEEQKTTLGSEVVMADGSYRVAVETLGILVNTGFCEVKKGMLTLFVTSGSLHVRRSRENSEEVDDMFKVHTGDFVTFNKGQKFSYGTGNETAGVVKIQSARLEIENITEPKLPETEVSVREVFSKSEALAFSPDRLIGEAKERKSRDPEYRAHIGALQAQDRNLSKQKQHMFRGAVPPRQASEVIPQHGDELAGTGDLANQFIPVVNPAPINLTE